MTNRMFANTAHLHQSIGSWEDAGLAVSLAQSSDLTPVFGSFHGVWNPNGAAVNSAIATSNGLTDTPIDGDTQYVVSVYVASDQADMQFRLRVEEFNAAGASLGLTNLAAYSTVGAINTFEQKSGTFTSQTDARYAEIRIQGRAVSGNLAGADKLYWDAACIKEGSDPAFVPSLKVEGDLDVRWSGVLSDYTPASAVKLVDKFTSTADGYEVGLTATDGYPYLTIYDDTGAADLTLTASAAPTATDGRAAHLQSTLDADNGATNSDGDFYELDGPDLSSATPSQVGATQNGGAVVSIGAGATALTVGDDSINVLSYQIRDGIDGPIVSGYNNDGTQDGSSTPMGLFNPSNLTLMGVG